MFDLLQNNLILIITTLPITGWLLLIILFNSFHKIGDTEVGLVSKRFALKKLQDGNPIAFNGEAGYQAELLKPGWRFKLWPIFSVKKYPWVLVPAGQIGVVISQIGEKLPVGSRSAVFREEFGDFSDLDAFIEYGGQKGVQRPVLPPGSLLPLHPVAFLVISKKKIYGIPLREEYQIKAKEETLTPYDFDLHPEQLDQVIIKPIHREDGKIIDVCGIVTTFEGKPLQGGAIASRLGNFEDIKKLKQAGASANTRIEALIGTKNEEHDNYQDYQKFLDRGGRIGLQHDPILYGAYNFNPFLISVEIVPMLVVNQGQVAVVKAYVGLPTEDTSGATFKYGSIVEPGHRGIWEEPLRTGKYAINPRCYNAEIVPTAIVTLNWADATSKAHSLDSNLCQIIAKSREGFVFNIDLQVQIHVPDTRASHVISMVGTMQNLVNEVLQAAVGNHFRDKLQAMAAVNFIEQRQAVQEEAFGHITDKLNLYYVETKGVYIQDVIFPQELVTVLTQREIARQRVETLQRQKIAEEERIEMEAAKGKADQQAELARSEIGVTIKLNNAEARKAEASGEASYISNTGKAAAAEVEAVGLARAKSYREQVAALGQTPTALINIAESLSRAGMKIVPDVLVSGGSGALEGLASVLMKNLSKGNPDSVS
jgi:regulator of protease activity HflC (stomatin/prohibitin superfamily)